MPMGDRESLRLSSLGLSRLIGFGVDSPTSWIVLCAQISAPLTMIFSSDMALQYLMLGGTTLSKSVGCSCKVGSNLDSVY